MDTGVWFRHLLVYISKIDSLYVSVGEAVSYRIQTAGVRRLCGSHIDTMAFYSLSLQDFYNNIYNDKFIDVLNDKC